MDDLTIFKVNKVNKILKQMELPITFSFACYDLKTYTPSFVLNRGAKIESCLTCTINNTGEIRFFFKKYPSQKEAKNYAEYIKNQNQIRKWDEYINQLNQLKLKVPKYKE